MLHILVWIFICKLPYINIEQQDLGGRTQYLNHNTLLSISSIVTILRIGKVAILCFVIMLLGKELTGGEIPHDI